MTFFTTLAASDWTSLSRLFAVSNQWPADDELDGYSGHCRFVLETEREKEEAVNERNLRRKERGRE